jgi:predicted N-acetyltransferase YhbS
MDGPRPVRPEEFDSLMEMINDVFTSQRRMMREAFPLLFNRDNLENLFVFVDEGRVVSHVGVTIRDILINGCRLRTANVGSVGTREEFRGRGFAGACLDAAEAKAVADGVSVTLISGRRSLYRRFGGVQVGSALVLEVPAGEADRGIDVRRAGPEDVAVLERLYEREPVRFIRPLEDWKAALGALEARSGGNHRHGVFILAEHREPAAYAIASRHVWDEKPHTSVAEFAGSRSAIIAALPHLASELGSERIEIKAASFDTALRAAAHEAGLSGREDYLLGHTVKVSSVENFWKDLRPLVEERIGAAAVGAVALRATADGGCEFACANEARSFSAPDFTALAFGQPGGPTEGESVGILERIFPIPLPFPGLNYV